MSSILLWLPPDPEDLLVVTVDKQATDSEFEKMLLLNQSALDWIGGDLDTGTYEDILESCGIPPETFIEEAEELVYRVR